MKMVYHLRLARVENWACHPFQNGVHRHSLYQFALSSYENKAFRLA